MHRCDFRLPVRVLAAAALPLMGAVTQDAPARPSIR